MVCLLQRPEPSEREKELPSTLNGPRRPLDADTGLLTPSLCLVAELLTLLLHRRVHPAELELPGVRHGALATPQNCAWHASEMNAMGIK